MSSFANKGGRYYIGGWQGWQGCDSLDDDGATCDFIVAALML